jgi:hypothetical protein
MEGRPPCRPGASDAAPTELRPPGAMERDFLEGRPPCRPGASDAAPTERRPPKVMERDFLEGRPPCRPGASEVAPTERRPPSTMERDFLEGRPPCRPRASDAAPTERRPPVTNSVYGVRLGGANRWLARRGQHGRGFRACIATLHCSFPLSSIACPSSSFAKRARGRDLANGVRRGISRRRPSV